MSYFQAYQAYQSSNYDRCLRLLANLEEDTKVLDLRAQVHFQRRQYQEAYDIYQRLLGQEEDSDYANERKENLLLVTVCAALETPDCLKTAGQPIPTADEIHDQVESIHLCNEPLVPKKNEKKKRKRSGPLPKNLVPGSEPDPERWIPKKDRKNNSSRPRKNKRKGGKGRGKSYN